MAATGTAATRATFGAAFVLMAASAVLADWMALSAWVTPIASWGYLFLVDALVERRGGQSFLARDPARFFGWITLSILFCGLSEASYLWLSTGPHVELSDEPALRLAGLAASFAAVLPGLFLTSAALAALGLFRRIRCRPWRPTERMLHHGIAAGFLSLCLPALLPPWLGKRLFALAGAGILLILEPLNRRLGAPSLLADLARGEPGRGVRLLLAGYIWGGILLFWNDRAAALCVASGPPLPPVRMFGASLAGFLASGPVAIEAYAMYNTVLGLWRKAQGRAAGEDPPAGINL